MLSTLINDSIKLAREREASLDINGMHLTSTHFILQFRTIGLLVPRCTGKSTTLNSFHHMHGSLLFNKVNRDKSVEWFDFERAFRGRNFHGAKFRYILLDEYTSVPQKVFDLITFLRINGLITDDFMIIFAGTPT